MRPTRSASPGLCFHPFWADIPGGLSPVRAGTAPKWRPRSHLLPAPCPTAGAEEKETAALPQHHTGERAAELGQELRNQDRAANPAGKDCKAPGKVWRRARVGGAGCWQRHSPEEGPGVRGWALSTAGGGQGCAGVTLPLAPAAGARQLLPGSQPGCPGAGQAPGAGHGHREGGGSSPARAERPRPWLAPPALHPHRTRKYGWIILRLAIFFPSHVILFLDGYFGAGLQPR